MSKAKAAEQVVTEKDLEGFAEVAAAKVEPMLALDEQRIISLKANDCTYTYQFRRLTAKDWLTFFASIVHQTIQVSGVRDTVYESESAQIALVDGALLAVTGYGDLSKLKNWKQAIPFQHRLAAGMVLRNVGVSTSAEDELLLSDLVEINLDAAWSSGLDGKMTFFQGLVHRFRHPSAEQLRRFNFESARVRVEGTSENGITTYPSRQVVAMKIYDELIDSVEGYSFQGKPLADTETIKREMDGAHKAEAAMALFSQGGAVRVL